MRVRFVSLLISLTIALGGFAGPVHADAVPPLRVAYFNNPITHAESADVNVPGAPSTITAAIIGLINAATPGASVNIAIFEFIADKPAAGAFPPDDTNLIVTALRAAMEREVTVNILADNKWRGNQRNWVDHLKNGTDPNLALSVFKKANVRYCNGSCFTSTSIMHNKFMLISDLSSTPTNEGVVLQMTANWTGPQLSAEYYNSAVQIVGDDDLYNGYSTYFNKLYSCGNTTGGTACEGGWPNGAYYGEAGGGANVNIFPKSPNTVSDADDPVLRQLEPVICSKLGLTSTVNIVMGSWNTNRGSGIAEALSTMQENGCQVNIVVQGGESIAEYLYTDTVLRPRCTANPNAEIDPLRPLPVVHSKYMIVEGGYGTNSLGLPNVGTAVFTGSHNFTHDAFRANDETWLRLFSWNATATTVTADATLLYGRFLADFAAIWGASLPCRPTQPV